MELYSAEFLLSQIGIFHLIILGDKIFLPLSTSNEEINGELIN